MLRSAHSLRGHRCSGAEWQAPEIGALSSRGLIVFASSIRGLILAVCDQGRAGIPDRLRCDSVLCRRARASLSKLPTAYWFHRRD